MQSYLLETLVYAAYLDCGQGGVLDTLLALLRMMMMPLWLEEHLDRLSEIAEEVMRREPPVVSMSAVVFMHACSSHGGSLRARTDRAACSAINFTCCMCKLVQASCTHSPEQCVMFPCM